MAPDPLKPEHYPRLVLKSQPAGYRFQTESYDTRQVIHVRKGLLILNENGRSQDLGPGRTLLLFPRTRFQLSCRKEGYEGIGILHASPQVVPGDAARPLTLPADAGLGELFAQAWAEVQGGANRTDLALAAARFLEAAVHTRALPLLAPRQPTLEDWLLRTAELLTQSTHERVQLRERLSGIPVSYAHLSRAFRRKWGVGLKQFLMRQKVAEARRLLEAGGASVTDIAFELGFASSQHFATCFKSLTGRSPTAWTRRDMKRQG
jgi:AraC-like DNA-binding protein